MIFVKYFKFSVVFPVTLYFFNIGGGGCYSKELYTSERKQRGWGSASWGKSGGGREVKCIGLDYLERGMGNGESKLVDGPFPLLDTKVPSNLFKIP